MKNQIIQRFVTLSILAIAAIFSLSIQTKATELLTNGGFETGLVGWTAVHNNTVLPNQQYVFGPGAGINLFENSNLMVKNPYLPPSFPQEGNRDAMIALTCQFTPTVTIRFYQNITVPAGNNLTLSWKQKFSQNNGAALSDENVVARVVIRNTSDVIVQTVYTKSLNNQTDEVFPWTNHSVNLGNTYAGQTIRIEFIAEVFDANAPNYATNRGLWEIDAVSANALPPTAAAVSLSGKIRDSKGKPMSQVRVRIMDMDGDVQSVLTNKFGYYEFREIEAGQTYAMEAFQKGVRFINNPRIINVADNIDGEDFHAEDPTISR